MHSLRVPPARRALSSAAHRRHRTAVRAEVPCTELLRYGQRVTVIALPAPPILLTPKGIEHVGPRAFGYDLDFRSVFA